MKRISLTSLIVMAGIIIMSSFSNAATPVFYTDRPTFEGTLSTILTDDYSTASGYPAGFGLYNNTEMSAFFGETDYQTTGHINLNIINSAAYCAGCNGSFLLSFTTTSVTESGTGVFGVGVNIIFNDSSTPYFAYITYGDSATESIPLPPGPSFFGVTAPELIQSIHFGLSGGGSTTDGSFSVDNLTIGNALTTADLSISKVADPDPVIAGQTLTYTVTVSNAGPSDATNVEVTDTLPPGTTLISTAGCAEDPNGIPICSLGTIVAGGSAQYTITTSVDPGITGTLTNNISVTSDIFDPDTSNNSVSVETAITMAAAIPTMTEWGMIIFIILTGLSSIYYMRRQKKA